MYIHLKAKATSSIHDEVGTVKVLMLGWEFPPFFAGGVGIVCYELTKALSKRGAEINYIMPFGPRNPDPQFLKQMLIAENLVPTVKVHTVKTGMHAYMSSEEYENEMKSTMLEAQKDSSKKALYGKNLYEEVHNFAHRATTIALQQDFDVIHCHDWMTIPAAVWIKQLTGKPLVVHIHNTVFDRYPNSGNPMEQDIEQLGLDHADRVICISEWVRKRLRENYRFDENKSRILYWGAQQLSSDGTRFQIFPNDKVVLFAGRVTAQKGPEFFIRAARRIADYDPNVKFVMAGSGDMLHDMIELATNLDLADRFFFPGFYTRSQVTQLFEMADIFVMPSVSEPFGIVPYEALSVGTPTIISKQSGVAEVLSHVLKVDFWDVDELAEKILAVLKYEELHGALKEHGKWEVQNMTWEKTAENMEHIYNELLAEVKH